MSAMPNSPSDELLPRSSRTLTITTGVTAQKEPVTLLPTVCDNCTWHRDVIYSYGIQWNMSVKEAVSMTINGTSLEKLSKVN